MSIRDDGHLLWFSVILVLFRGFKSISDRTGNTSSNTSSTDIAVGLYTVGDNFTMTFVQLGSKSRSIIRRRFTFSVRDMLRLRASSTTPSCCLIELSSMSRLDTSATDRLNSLVNTTASSVWRRQPSWIRCNSSEGVPVEFSLNVNFIKRQPPEISVCTPISSSILDPISSLDSQSCLFISSSTSS